LGLVDDLEIKEIANEKLMLQLASEIEPLEQSNASLERFEWEHVSESNPPPSPGGSSS
jgi:hypothetical protein